MANNPIGLQIHPTYHAATDASKKAPAPKSSVGFKGYTPPKSTMKKTDGGFDYMGNVKPSNIGLPNSPTLKSK